MLLARLGRALHLHTSRSVRLSPILSQTHLAMPRRPRAAAIPAIPAASSITNATAGAAAPTSPAASSGHTLVHALENMPVVTVLPKTVDFDGDLTPPPQEVKEKTGELVERAVEKVVGRAEKRKRSKPVSYAEQPGEDGEDEEDVQTKPKTGRSRRKAAATEDETFAEESVSITTPKKGKGRKNAPAPIEDEDEDSPKEKKAKKPTPKKSRLAKDEPEYDSKGNENVKKKRKPKVYPKIEYDIPPVERKETTFRGESCASPGWTSDIDAPRPAGVCLLEHSA